jgi:hypothetical protein
MEQLAAELTPFLSGGSPSAVVVDEKTAGTQGGTFTSGAWRTRDLTVIQSDPSGIIVGLAINQVTLAAGTYAFFAVAPAFRVQNHKTRLRNQTAGTDIAFGQSMISSLAEFSDNASAVFGQATFAVQTDVRVQHRGSNTQATNGFGNATGFVGEVEVYTVLNIVRIPGS